jgi:large subunit ribosomal protein L19
MPITISSANREERKNLGLKPGDTVRVWQKIIERVKEKDKVKEKTRLQAFEGLVLARKHGREAGATFTVRRIVDGVGVERIFPLYAPMIDKVEILKRAKVRRAKLYYVRRKAAKEIRKAMRHERIEKKENLQPTTDHPQSETAEAKS